MSASADLPPPDQIAGAPHPRDAARLFGQNAAQADFLDAFASGRLHHAWLLTGPPGVGKATLAWRIARFLLATPLPGDGVITDRPTALDIPADHPVARRVAAGSEPRLAHITRSANEKTGRMRTEIVVEDIRKLHRFLALSATDGGARVVIVDAADEMNASAANALLKMLEEPPALTTLLLVSHQPSALLPTIRSRCRVLRLAPLRAQDMQAALAQAGTELSDNPDQLAALAAGSVGGALRLLNLDGLRLYHDLVVILGSLPRLDRQRALALAETAAQRNAAERFDLLLNLIDIALSRLARCGATGTPPLPEAARDESAILSRLAATPAKGRAWADTAATITARNQHGQAVNLDPAALVLDTVFRIQKTAQS
ncbi:DNA polymerase III subunit delta' [Pontibaca salina]|uniref:DNA polymerase III subunit delta n=1 Tax=Pontibaca salina TaxID=2795731 RepID=A0A934M232_9RHOB|nr:DNA polymerase III subunit delta' [Pontibaca salina]MBI6628394.1 DNA polymerase III subunit delta' [Pontibaca salina]